jgi:hypothetical protein
MRPVRLARAGYALMTIAVAFVLGSLIPAVVLHNQSEKETARRERLEREGVNADATILRLWRSGGKDDERYVRYEFQADGLGREGSSKVPRQIWLTLQVGGSLPVRYLAEDPEINHPAGWRMGVTPAWLAILVPGIQIGVAGLLLTIIRRQWRLLSEGRPAPGVVIKARRREKQVVLNYEFRLLSGATGRGRSSTNARSVPGEGSVVCVIYDPENPRRNGVYPFSLVRVEDAATAQSRLTKSLKTP